MKQKVFLLAALLVALVLPQSVRAYAFTSVAPSGQTLYYNIVGGNAQVTSQYSSSPYYSTYPTGAITIPNTVTYNGITYPVTSIGDTAFFYCSDLTSVTIPNSVTTIGNGAFQFCYALTSVTIPNSVTTIGNAAFRSCSRELRSVTIPNSVTSIGDYAFDGCLQLTSVNIPNTITTIGNNTFSGCASLRSITIPNSVTTIGNSAFHSSGLITVTIGDSVTTIGDYAFASCRNLTFVTIPKSVTTIGYHAFGCCWALTYVTIEGSPTIDGYAFYGCSSLTAITCLSMVAPPLIGRDIFVGVTSTIPVYIPCGSLSSYDSNWTYFSNFIETLSFVLRAESADIVMGTATITARPICTDSTAVFTATANDGYLFDHWSDGTTINPYMITVTSDTTLIAYFIEEVFSFKAETTDSSMGVVVVLNAPTRANPDAMVIAIPANGHSFDHWSDGTTLNPYTLTVTSDTTIIAYFVSDGGTDGIDNVCGENTSVYVRDRHIVVSGAEDANVQVYDITGRPVTNHGTLPTGVYMVKVGTQPIRKVVVIQ